MKRRVKLVVLVAGGVVLLALVAGGTYQSIATSRDIAGTPPPGDLVDVGEHRLHIWCSGVGSPTVVFDSGLGGTSFDWANVQPAVAELTRSCSYDRAGLGYSDPGPVPRTSGRIADELHALLNEYGIAGPVILVGGSYGGFNVRVFSDKYPDAVAGMVLVDASHEDGAERFAAVGAPPNTPPYAPLVRLVIPFGILRLVGVTSTAPTRALPEEVRPYVEAVRYRTSAYRAAASELLNMDESIRQVKELSGNMQIPLVVASAGIVAGDPPVAEVRREMQRDLVGLSKRSCQMIAERSPHAVWLGQPQIIVTAIRAVVDAIDDSSASPVC